MREPQTRRAPSPSNSAFTRVFDALCGGGLGRGAAHTRVRDWMPPPCPSPASGGGDDVALPVAPQAHNLLAANDILRAVRAAAFSPGAGALAAPRDRVLARDPAPIRAHAQLSGVGEPDRDYRAVCPLARSDPRLCRDRLARPCRLLRLRLVHRGA